MERLRKLRVIVSIFFFFVTSLLFVELSGEFTLLFSDEILFLQFIPSLLSFLTVFSLTTIGFLVVILITSLFGRVYCSSICPLGTFIDIIGWFKKKYHKRKTKKLFKYSYEKPYHKTRYAILSLVVLLFFAGSSMGIVLLDPYSNFGRLITNFARPFFVGFNNLMVYVLEFFEEYSLIKPEKFDLPGIEIYLFPLFILTIVLLFSWKHGRLYCNTICPVGSLLGLISKFSVYKIKIDDITCVECGVCATVCKSNCIDTENKKIDFTRCVSCFNCFQKCPTEAILYTKPLEKTEFGTKDIADNSRRSFMISAGLLSTALAKKVFPQGEILVYTENEIPVNRAVPITPPGSISIEHFISKCTACTLCVSACPTNVLQPSLMEYGINGLLMPHMNNRVGFCNFECTICSEVCPNYAILPIEKEEKKLKQIGKAKFIKDNCVVYTQKTDCGACAEHCPTKAVRMVMDNEVGKKAPKVDDKICVGCGACEYACPTKPYKAIYVEGNAVHQLAEKPPEEKIEEEVDLKEDFPF